MRFRRMRDTEKPIKKIDTIHLRFHGLDDEIIAEWVFGALLTVEGYVGVWTFLPLAAKSFTYDNNSEASIYVKKATVESEFLSEQIPYRFPIPQVRGEVVAPKCKLTLQYHENEIARMTS